MSWQQIKKAIKENKLKALKKLVEQYPVIVNLENSDGSTPLFMAVHEEHLEIVKYLIDNEADINHKSTKDGWTVLHLACHLENVDIVNLLLDNDADIELTTNTGETPLYFICETGSNIGVAIKIIEALLDAEAEQGVSYEYINQKNDDGYFPLYIASKNGGKDVVELLIERGANLEETNDLGQTALMIAIQENTDGSHLEVIDALLGADADVLSTDNNGHNILFYAQESNDAEVFELLLRYANSSRSSNSSGSSDSLRRSNSSRSSTSSRSKSFSVGSVEPTVLDVVTIKQSKIPKTAEDFVNMEDVNIADFLAENNKNKIIKVHNSFYALNGEDVKDHFLSKAEKNNYVYYPCKRALPPPALGVSKDDVHMDKPLFSASYLVGILSDFVLLSEVMAMLASESQYFEIMANSEVQHVPATASAQMFTSDRNAVSANHCQEGKEAKILKLKRLDIVEGTSLSKSSKKDKTVASLGKSSKKDKTGSKSLGEAEGKRRTRRRKLYKMRTVNKRRPMKSRRNTRRR